MRHEVKYYFPVMSAQIIKSKLREILPIDANSNDDGSYQISSIYIDSIDRAEICEKLSGENRRVKFRYRSYNEEWENGRLEAKTRIGAFILKEKLSREIVLPDLATPFSFALSRNINQTSQAIPPVFLKLFAGRFKWGVVVSYKRTAFIGQFNNIRITVDENLKARKNISQTLESGMPLNLDGKVIVEIKYDNFFPDYLSRIFNTIPGGTREAISKYSIANKYLKFNSWEDN